MLLYPFLTNELGVWPQCVVMVAVTAMPFKNPAAPTCGERGSVVKKFVLYQKWQFFISLLFVWNVLISSSYPYGHTWKQKSLCLSLTRSREYHQQIISPSSVHHLGSSPLQVSTNSK